MLFSSYVFIACFLPAALCGFFVLARIGGRVAAAWWLIGASFFFYGWWNPAFVPVLVASIGFNATIGWFIGSTKAATRLRLALLVLGIGGDVGALIYFKYLADLLSVFGIHGIGGGPLPLGISFFTFTQIGFLIDTYQEAADERGLLNYLLFVTFFPHLIAGPLLHHREMMPQFAARTTYRFSAEDLAVGLAIFSMGLVKKAVFADSLSPIAIAGFAHRGQLALFPAWEAALAYSLQLYFDFSGYSDMAIGVARMFNVRFPANFNSPYKAQSVIEYWQRWHMTLTRYLITYLYNPLALRLARRRVARGGKLGRHLGAGGFATTLAFPTALTMTLAGVWHGSGLTFLVFGLLHAAYLCVNHAWRMFRPVWCKPAAGRMAICRRVVLTYLSVLIGAVVFRADSLASAGAVLAGMAGLHGMAVVGVSAERALTVGRDWAMIVLLGAVVFLAPNTQSIMRNYAPILGGLRGAGVSWRPSVGWAVALGGIGALGVLAVGGSGEFLYFQF